MNHEETSRLAAQITAGLATRIIGRTVLVYPSVTSTNTVVKTMAAEGADEGLVVLAEVQSAGRGRHGRRWEAPPGSSILMSVLFRPELPAEDAGWLTMLVSLAAIDAIREVTGLEAAIKWPNDILIDHLKVGGVLTESSLVGDRLEYAVVGLGLNVNFDPRDYPEIPPTASSLLVRLGRPVDRVTLMRAILMALDRRYCALKAGHSPYQEWSQHLATLGQRVRVVTPTGTLEGTAEGANLRGDLQVRRDDGRLVELVVGDVITLSVERGDP